MILVSQNFIATEQSSSTNPANVVCENGVCTIKKDPQPSAPSTSTEGDGLALYHEEKLEKAKQLLEAKRLEKEKEEKEVRYSIFNIEIQLFLNVSRLKDKKR